MGKWVLEIRDSFHMGADAESYHTEYNCSGGREWRKGDLHVEFSARFESLRDAMNFGFEQISLAAFKDSDEQIEAGEIASDPDRIFGQTVYFIQEMAQENIKIGYTANLSKRFKAIAQGMPQEIKLLTAFNGTEENERWLHAKFQKHRVSGEWFKPSSSLLSLIRYLQGSKKILNMEDVTAQFETTEESEADSSVEE